MSLFRAKKVNRDVDDLKVLIVGITIAMFLLLLQPSLSFLCNKIYLEPIMKNELIKN